MATNYDEFALVWTYHNANKSDYDPTDQELIDWDQELYDRYEAKLDAPMTAAGLPLNRTTKSQVVALAEVSNGSNDSTLIKNACKFLAAVPDTG
jgi:hypothetical protein